MGVGVWVAVDPAGFQDIVATKPVLRAGAYLLLAVGIALSLLGFLGCCGALRRSRLLLLVVSEGRVGRAGGCRAVGCGVSPEETEDPSWPCQPSTHPPIPLPHCETLNLKARGFNEALGGIFSP